MHRFLLVFIALVALSLPAYGTDIQISIQTLSQLTFNPASLGPDRVITGVSVTNASFTITSAAAFPPQAVGMGGFQIDIGGNQYQVESVLSTSSANLTTQFAGLTGTTSITWYKWAVLRVYNTSGFAWQPLNSSEIIQPGTVGSGNWYKQVGCSVVNPGSGNILWIPEFTISATTDSPTNNNAVYSFAFFTPANSLLNYFLCGSKNQLKVPPASPTTLAAICNYNNGPITNIDNRSYTTTQIDARFPSCLGSSLAYYAASGQVQSCLTLGAGLSIAPGGILNSAGGSGLADPGANGIVARTAAGITAPRTLTGTANEITVTNGTGLLANPTFALAATFDISGKTSTKPMKSGTAPPGTCAVGEYFFDNNAPAGQNTYACTAVNTWTLQGGSASIAAGALNQLAYYASAGTALSPLTFNSNYFAVAAAVLSPKNNVESYNVKTDFGCVGDGVANDTACLASAITSATLNSKSIYLPGGNTFLVTGITLPGRIRMYSDYDRRARIKSTTNAAIVSLIGDGGVDFRGPTLENVEIQGAVGAGSNQIGLNVTDGTYVHSIRVHKVTIIDTGGYGLFVGNAYSSSFEDIFIENNAGYPLLYEGTNMPANLFRNVYVGNLRNSAISGFRIKSGRFVCVACNGVNNIPAGSAIVTIGRKSGVDGDVTNSAAFAHFTDSNFESYNIYGIRHYSDSASIIDGLSTFAGDPANLGNLQPLAYEVISGNFPDFTPRRGLIADTVVFGDGGYANYANSQPIHSTGGIPPLMVDGMGPGVASELTTDPVATYFDHTLGTVQLLKRGDAALKRVTVTASTTFTRTGVRYIEVNCAAACAVTLPWPGWYRTGEEIVVKDVSGAAATNNITINAASGGFVNNAGSVTINKNGGFYRFAPNDTATDWRVIGVGTAAFPVYNTGSAGGFAVCFDGAGVNITNCSGLYDLGGNTMVFMGNVLFNTDNASDIGGSGTNRPRTGYFGTSINIGGTVSGSLGADPNGVTRYCSNCNVNTDPCTGGGTGAIAHRLNGRWYCP